MTPRRSATTALAASAVLALTTPALAGDDSCLGSDPISDIGILEINPGADISSVLGTYGFTLIDSIPSQQTYLVQLHFQMTHEQFEQLWIADPRVDDSELNYESGDPGPGTQSIFLFTPPGSFANQPVIESLGLEDAQLSYTGAGVTIAVIDSGVDPSHPFLAGHIAPGGIAFTDDPGDTFEDTCNGANDDGDALVDEGVGHGTAVASLALLVAPDAQILPIKVLNDEGYTDAFDVAKAIHYAVDQGARVINLSLSSCADLRIIHRAVDRAIDHGVVVIGAAGNHATHSDVVPEFPAAMGKVIGVAASDLNGTLAGFSNYGRDYLIAAPGIDLIGAIPTANCGGALPLGDYGEADGTSLAAPLASGTAALLIEKGTVIRYENFRDAMRDTSLPIDAQNPGISEPVREGLLDVAGAVAWAGPCHADITDDEVLDFSDVTAFLDAFITGDSHADFVAPRGAVDFSDVVQFLVYFAQGCP